jgi:hypothetical protein
MLSFLIVNVERVKLQIYTTLPGTAGMKLEDGSTRGEL